MSISVETAADGRKVCPVDHHSVEFGQNYREIQDQIREVGPAVWSDQHGGFWFVTDFESVRAALLDHETFTVDPVKGFHEFGLVIPKIEAATALAETPGFFFFVDGEHHDIPKALLSPPLSKRRLAKQADMIHTHVNRELDRVLPRGEFDVVHDLGTPAVAAVCSELLGLDLEDPSASFSLLPGPPGQSGRADNEDRSEQDAMSLPEALVYVGKIVQARKDEPRDDLISLMVRANDCQFSVEEVSAMCLQILFGALENPQALLGHCMAYLEDRPELRAQLRANPSLIPSFIEEAIRYFPAGMTTSRTATRDVVLGGMQIRRGDRVLLSQSAANMDPAKYTRPHEFDFERPAPETQHLALGAGVHTCLGQHLVRAVVESLLKGLLDRIEEYSFDPDKLVGNVDKASNDLFEKAWLRVIELRAADGHDASA